MSPRAPIKVLPWAIVGVLVLFAASFVVVTLRRPAAVEGRIPTSPAPREAGAALVGPVVVTIDARDGSAWRRFDFSRGAVIEGAAGADWDVAFRRHEIAVNAEAGAGAVALPPAAFDSVAAAPEGGYGPDAFEKWYDYGFTTHVLAPRPVVYAIRTADGRYAKLEIVGYYCPEATSGCPTLRYVYQGDGTRAVSGAR